jgi:hypothetical protein
VAGNFLAGLHWKKQRGASCSFKMISFSNINKQYGKQLPFVDASFRNNAGGNNAGTNSAGTDGGVPMLFFNKCDNWGRFRLSSHFSPHLWWLLQFESRATRPAHS